MYAVVRTDTVVFLTFQFTPDGAYEAIATMTRGTLDEAEVLAMEICDAMNARLSLKENG